MYNIERGHIILEMKGVKSAVGFCVLCVTRYNYVMTAWEPWGTRGKGRFNYQQVGRNQQPERIER